MRRNIFKISVLAVDRTPAHSRLTSRVWPCCASLVRSTYHLISTFLPVRRPCDISMPAPETGDPDRSPPTDWDHRRDSRIVCFDLCSTFCLHLQNARTQPCCTIPPIHSPLSSHVYGYSLFLILLQSAGHAYFYAIMCIDSCSMSALCIPPKCARSNVAPPVRR